jgi:monoamine oxidase
MEVKMPPEKRRCINEMGYGNSGKFIMGVNSKPWRGAGQRGYTFSDLEFGCGWDSSLMQSEEEGSFTIFGGGKFMDNTCVNTTDGILKKMLPQMDKIYPGFSKAFNHKTTKYCWSKNPYTKAGYCSFKKGQWSTIAGWEQLPVGNIYFAGEHVSKEFQGYMNGAAQSGREAAEMVYDNVMKRRKNELET